MSEGVVGGEILGLGSSEEDVVAAHEGDRALVPSQSQAVTQSYRQLHRVVGFEGMALGELCCGLKVTRGE